MAGATVTDAVMANVKSRIANFLMRPPWLAKDGDCSHSTCLSLKFLAQLEQADIRPGALLGVETGFDPGNRFHESEIQTESVGSALDLTGASLVNLRR